MFTLSPRAKSSVSMQQIYTSHAYKYSIIISLIIPFQMSMVL